jgi:hypothetical protein
MQVTRASLLTVGSNNAGGSRQQSKRTFEVHNQRIRVSVVIALAAACAMHTETVPRRDHWNKLT